MRAADVVEAVPTGCAPQNKPIIWATVARIDSTGHGRAVDDAAVVHAPHVVVRGVSDYVDTSRLRGNTAVTRRVKLRARTARTKQWGKARKNAKSNVQGQSPARFASKFAF